MLVVKLFDAYSNLRDMQKQNKYLHPIWCLILNYIGFKITGKCHMFFRIYNKPAWITCQRLS